MAQDLWRWAKVWRVWGGSAEQVVIKIGTVNDQMPPMVRQGQQITLPPGQQMEKDSHMLSNSLIQPLPHILISS